jgi:hypothetical protein
MAAVLIPVLIVLVLVGVFVVAVIALTRRRTAWTQRLQEGQEHPYLRYRVPSGVDMAAVLVAVENEGYAATSDLSGTHHEVLIVCPAGTERERARVRAAIHHASNPEGDDLGLDAVRFTDEDDLGPASRRA